MKGEIMIKEKVTKIIMSVLLIGQVLTALVVPLFTHASVLYPKEVTVEFDKNELYTMSGQFKDGTPYSRKDAPVFAVYDGKKQPLFCIEPAVMIDRAITNGYTSNPLPAIANKARAKYISVLWKYVGADHDTQIVAQTMIWEEVNDLVITNIVRPDGTTMNNFQSIKDKVNKVVNDYQKKPSFDGQTVKVNLGESVTLTDIYKVDLSRFDGANSNSANVDWSIKGDNLIITPKKDSNLSGKLRVLKTMDAGTPVAYRLAGQQTLMAGAIDDPNGFQINLEIVKNGEVKIKKVDKGTGKVVPNTEFKVEYNGKSQKVKTDEKGEAIVKDVPHDAKVKVTETFVPTPYILDKNNTKEVIVKAGKTASVEFKNEVATGKTTLTKQDVITKSDKPLNPNYSMEGAKYGLFKSDGTLLKEFTLDTKLTATMEKLELGSYYWQETVAPAGYTLDPEKHAVELTYKDQYTPVVVKDTMSNDDVIRMNFKGQKVIQNETNEIFKNDVELTAVNQRTQEKTVVKTTNVNGKSGYFEFKDMPIDDYVVTETKGVEGYRNIDPIEITHKYDKEKNTFVFVVKDQKNGNVLNEETITQEELSKGENVDLGTYTLKDKAKVNEEPIVGISTQAHTGDGETQTFVWGEDVKFYDDVTITTENISSGTVLVYETIQVAVYLDGKEKDVWTSGKNELKITDKKMTERVLSEYDYKKDPEGTRYYFKEVVYEPVDAKHNFDGKEKTQDIKPIVKETPEKEEKPKDSPKLKENLPYTGEQIMHGATVVGLMLFLGVVGAIYLRHKKTKEKGSKEDK
jgi:LPXTG-motif cell wall-anchored protein